MAVGETGDGHGLSLPANGGVQRELQSNAGTQLHGRRRKACGWAAMGLSGLAECMARASIHVEAVLDAVDSMSRSYHLPNKSDTDAIAAIQRRRGSRELCKSFTLLLELALCSHSRSPKHIEGVPPAKVKHAMAAPMRLAEGREVASHARVPAGVRWMATQSC